MNRLILVGSPRANGRSAALADQLFEACIEDFPNDEVALAPVSTLDIAGCTGCDACKRGGGFASAESASGESASDEPSLCDFADAPDKFRCAIRDDMDEIYPLIDAADEMVVVSPVYFAGAPSQLKALLDRLQPYFWTDARMRHARPAALHVVGEGGDPHGFAPLMGTVRSALSVAGFSLDTVYDWVGKIDESGTIVAEAAVEELNDTHASQGDGFGGKLASEPDEEPATKPLSENSSPKGHSAEARFEAEVSDAGLSGKDSSSEAYSGKAPSAAGEKRAKLQLFDKQTASFSQSASGGAPHKGARGNAGAGAQGGGAREKVRGGQRGSASKGKASKSTRSSAKGSQGKSGGKGRSRRA